MNRFLAVAAVLLLLAPRLASACSCLQPEGTEEEQVGKALESAKAVFVGRASRIEEGRVAFGPGEGSSGQTTTFDIDRIWKGPATGQLRTRIVTECCVCGFEFKQGESYLVYATGPDNDGFFSTSICSRTRLAADGKADIEILGQLAPAPVTLAGDERKAKEVWRTFERWLTAYARGELEPAMSIFAPDVIFSFQGSADQSLADLWAAYVADFKSRKPGAAWVPQVEEVYADDKLAFVRARWELVTTAGKERTVKERNRSLDVLRYDDARGWVIFRSMNFPETVKP